MWMAVFAYAGARLLDCGLQRIATARPLSGVYDHGLEGEMRNQGMSFHVENTTKRASLIFAFVVAICSADIAQAVDGDCLNRNGETCSANDRKSPEEASTLRESLDKAKTALAEQLFGFQFSAFGDVQSGYDDAGKQKLNWGSFELDVSGDFSDNMQAAMAVVQTQERASLATGFLDYHISGGRIAPRGRLWVEKGFHFQAGRFDVPFGNDWQFFASKDSVSITRPITTELIMAGGYNDKGIRVLGNNGSVNFNAFLLRGFNKGRLVGGRVGLTPFSDPFSLKGAREPKTLELGLSYFYDANTSWKKNETGFAVDSEVHLDAWTGRFEYLVRKTEPQLGMERTTLRGWHITQEYALGEVVSWPTTIFARYDQSVMGPPDIDVYGATAGDSRDVRVAAGFSSNLFNSNILQWKFEVQHYRAATSSTREIPGFGRSILWLTQLVVIL